MKNWECLFQNHILERGYDYYLDDHVYDINDNGSQITANVSGTQEYQVSIKYKGVFIQEIECNCPYALKGKHCKHEAAVLFALDDEEEPSESETNLTVINITNNDIFEKLEQLKIEDCKIFIKEIIEQSDLVRDEFLYRFMKDRDDINLILQQMQKELAHYEYSFIDYQDAKQFYDAIMNVFDHFEDYMQPQRYHCIVETIFYCYPIFLNLEIDESDGYLSELTSRCIYYLDKILEDADYELKEEILDFICMIINHPNMFEEEAFVNLLFIHYYDPVYKIKISELAETMCNDENHYHSDQWLLLNLSILDEKDKEAFIQNHYDNYIIRLSVVEEKINNKDYDTAIKIINDSFVIDTNYRGYLKEMAKLLIKIYGELNLKEKQIEVCQRWLTEFYIGDLEAFKLLEELYLDKWSDMRFIIIDKLERQGCDMAEIYQEEKLCEQLLHYLENNNTIFKLIAYDHILVDGYAEVMLGLYENAIQKEASLANNRKQYRKVIQYTQHMLKYEKGKEASIHLLNKLMKVYSNRPAMMDEIQQEITLIKAM